MKYEEIKAVEDKAIKEGPQKVFLDAYNEVTPHGVTVELMYRQKKWRGINAHESVWRVNGSVTPVTAAKTILMAFERDPIRTERGW